MITIWKYQLKVDDVQWVDLPRGYKILSIGVQYNIPCMWVQVDSEATATDSILIITHGTGHPMKDANMEFLGTYMLYDDSFVGHVFKPIK